MSMPTLHKAGTSQTRFILRTALVVFFILPPALQATEGKRVAFVVGVGKYDNFSSDKQLRNAINDAEGVSAKLKEIGYQVTRILNPSRSMFNEKWQDVLDSLREDDTFVLFFSGHGVQLEGQNYLLPSDIPFIDIRRSEQLKGQSISLNEVLAGLSIGDHPHPKNAIVILDACRDNPLIPFGYDKSLTTVKGLASLPEPDGIFVLYAAASNQKALDRLSSSDTAKYSVFTRTLLPLMGRKDLDIQELSKEVKDRVWKLTKSIQREQRPTSYDGTVGRFCLPGCVVDPPPFSYGRLPIEMNGNDDAPMVLIPGGEFTMGSSEDDGNAEDDERPAHPVNLDTFYIDQFEVTVSRYAKFLQGVNGTKPVYWSEQTLTQHAQKPVVGVNWDDAQAYCNWAGKRLPTEAEWEKAARRTGQRMFPWGNATPNHKLANIEKCCNFNDYGSLTEVGSFDTGKSPYNVYDMAGNVWEWVADWYGETYYDRSPDRNPKGPSEGILRVVRGGSWNTRSAFVRSAFRDKLPPTAWRAHEDGDLGFRCVQDISPLQNPANTRPSVSKHRVKPNRKPKREISTGSHKD